MATSLTDILAALQNGVTSINRVAANFLTGSTTVSDAITGVSSAILSVFPHTTASSTGATGGVAALPAAPAGFLVVQTSSGYLCKVPYYNP